MPISLFKVLFKVLTSLKIVSYTVYVVVKFIPDLNHSQCPMADPFCQLFSVCVSVLQKVFPEPLFKEIKLSRFFLSYYIVLLYSSMYLFWELSQSVCNCIIFLFYIPFFWSGSSMSTRIVSVSFTFGPSEPRTVPGTSHVLDNFLYLMPSTVSGHQISGTFE